MVRRKASKTVETVLMARHLAAKALILFASILANNTAFFRKSFQDGIIHERTHVGQENHRTLAIFNITTKMSQ
jgi:hypothetical protein